MRAFSSGLFKFFLGALVIALFFWLAGAFVFLVKTTSFKAESPHVPTEAIVVLTGGNDRIATGLSLWADGLAPEIFISGVHPNNTRPQILASWKGDKNLPFCCMTLGYEARTTIENASEVHDWITNNHIRSVRLVTSDYHMPRAQLELSQTLPDTRFYLHPVPEIKKRWSSSYFRYVIFEEYHKYLWREFQILTGYKGEPWKYL